MSEWSSCYAIIEVSTFKSLPNFKRILDAVLQQAPKITGSERDCDITYKIDELGIGMPYPCRTCPFYNELRDALIIRKDYIFCPGAENVKENQIDKLPCNTKVGNAEFWKYISQYQAFADITICGYLRDRTRETTEKEFKAFIHHLKHFLPGVFQVKILVKKIE